MPAPEAGHVRPRNSYRLADALGLTATQLNRLLRRLRKRGPATFQGG